MPLLTYKPSNGSVPLPPYKSSSGSVPLPPYKSSNGSISSSIPPHPPWLIATPHIPR